MPLDFFYDIFLLHFALKSPQRAFQRLAILQMDFCQLEFTTFRKDRDLLDGQAFSVTRVAYWCDGPAVSSAC